MKVLLSHRLDENQPNWPGAPGLRLRPSHQIAAGDIANTHVIEIYSHYGSHCDVPYHFLSDGATMTDLDLDDFVFERPLLLEVPLADDELLTPGHLRPYESQIARADLVLLRSGFQQHRDARERYESHGPGFSADTAAFLRQAGPSLRGVALDWLSVCAVQNPDPGVEAHKELLRSVGHQSVLIFEDVDLAALGDHSATRVWAMPLFIDGLDGSPCTIVAEVS